MEGMDDGRMKKRIGIALTGSIALAGLVAPTARGAGVTPPKKTPALVEKGKAAFGIYCVPCHGATGDGDGPASAALNPRPRRFRSDPFKLGERPEDVWKTITDGSSGTAMVGWASIPEEDRWGLVYYVLSFRPASAAPAAPAKVPPRSKSRKK